MWGGWALHQAGAAPCEQHATRIYVHPGVPSPGFADSGYTDFRTVCIKSAAAANESSTGSYVLYSKSLSDRGGVSRRSPA